MEAWKKENGMTILAQISAPLLSASGQFRWGKLQTDSYTRILLGDGMEIGVKAFPLPYPACPVPYLSSSHSYPVVSVEQGFYLS